MEFYTVKKFQPHDVTVSVPASKSILNRALLLAALSKGSVTLICGNYAEDTRALIGCLKALGIAIEPRQDGLLVTGCGGNIPNRRARLDVMSAGTAARFLPIALSFCGGEYLFTASEQMKKRPMEVLNELERAGVEIEYLEEAGHFPFLLRSNGFSKDRLEIDTDHSTQYASGMLMAAMIFGKPFTLTLHGARTNSSYIAMTLSMLEAFHVPFVRNGDEITVSPQTDAPACYEVEPDLSGACYFYALALLCSVRVCVRGVKRNTLQGDFAFLNLLQARGVKLIDTEAGLLADGTQVSSFDGFQENMRDFSDQTLTVAALAPFADSPSKLSGVEHIRFQECDRVNAILENLTALGVSVCLQEDSIVIQPSRPNSGQIKTFRDHRVAMAFSLLGLKIGDLAIENPSCVQKTFDNYFDLLDEITA